MVARPSAAFQILKQGDALVRQAITAHLSIARTGRVRNGRARAARVIFGIFTCVGNRAMEFQKHTIIFIFIAGAILGGVVGYGAGFSQGIKQTPILPPPFSPSSDIFSLSGTVKELRDNLLIIEARIPSDSGEITIAPREIVITERTIIQKARIKSPDELIAELKDYQTGAAKGAQIPASPGKIVGNATLQDIKGGEEVVVESDENIKDKTRFEAVKVIVLQ